MEISLDDYLGQRGLRSPISGYMDDKWRNMRLTARGQKRFEKEAEAAIIEYSKLRKAAIDEYNNLVKSGEIIPPHETEIGSPLECGQRTPRITKEHKQPVGC